MFRNPPAPRANRIHSSPRDQVLARGPRIVPPAWRQQHQEQVVRTHETRVSVPSTSHRRLEAKPGGAILVENLPPDTTAQEVAELFKSTASILSTLHLEKGLSRSSG
ncbi:hypothetical protein BS47DRAFT_1337075 [Hydnum rufescens UP504]|uniref:RRM domain-containing protein n=1 Tax=Hydnum rufescens UP504 TaxID=1448309 RepID=A0A9P6B7R0_9AGAM|nr:hypothetical protein BS47DRAFT_1337075 [Hydnum rufescens UP504]